MHLSALSFQEVQYQRTLIVFKCLSFYEFQSVAKLWPKLGATIMFVCCDKNQLVLCQKLESGSQLELEGN